MSRTAGDLEPPLTGTALDGTVGVNLTTATSVAVHIRRPDGTLIQRAPVLTNQTTTPGGWTLALVAGDLNLPGQHDAELQVTWPGARPQTFGPTRFHVEPQIA